MCNDDDLDEFTRVKEEDAPYYKLCAALGLPGHTDLDGIRTAVEGLKTSLKEALDIVDDAGEPDALWAAMLNWAVRVRGPKGRRGR